MKPKIKYPKSLFSVLLGFSIRLIQLITQKYRNINRFKFIKVLFKVLFLVSLFISLSLGQVVSAQDKNANSLVERGIQDYKNGNFHSAEKHWQSALTQYKKNPSMRAVVNENLGRVYQKIGEETAAIEE